MRHMRALFTPEPNSNKYHDYECCEWTRGIDTLLSRYNKDHDEVISLVTSNPDLLLQTIWTRNGPLAIDNECRCLMGKGEIRSTYTCAQCKNLRRLIDFRTGGVGKEFMIECGVEAGRKLIVTAVDVPSPFLSWDDDSAYRARNYVTQYNNLLKCGTPDISNLRCITGDSFTTRALIHLTIYRLFSIQALPHIPKLHTVFICRNKGYSLQDTSSIGNICKLSSIDACLALSFIKQLVIILLELSQVNMSHGSPSTDALIINEEPISYLYDGVHVEGEMTLQLSEFWNSSATFNGVHYFPRHFNASMQLERGMFVPEISTQKVSMAHCHENPQITSKICQPQDAVLFRLTSSTIEIFNAMRHIGFPLYVGCFDLYCFMVSLMCNKMFYDAVCSDEELNRIWSMMWLIEDFPRIQEKIQMCHELKICDHQTAVNIIRGSWLRCDIVQYLWNLIKLI